LVLTKKSEGLFLSGVAEDQSKYSFKNSFKECMSSDSNVARTRARELFEHQHAVFFRTVEAYVEVCNLPPLAALQMDDELPLPRILTPGGIALDFKIDVEIATTSVLKDEPDMQAV
jgi:hypothetical protein